METVKCDDCGDELSEDDFIYHCVDCNKTLCNKCRYDKHKGHQCNLEGSGTEMEYIRPF